MAQQMYELIDDRFGTDMSPISDPHAYAYGPEILSLLQEWAAEEGRPVGELQAELERGFRPVDGLEMSN